MTPAVLLDHVQVGVTDAGRLDAHEHLARARARSTSISSSATAPRRAEDYTAGQPRAVEIRELRCATRKRERQVDLRHQVLDQLLDPALPADGERVGVRTAEQHGVGAERHRLQRRRPRERMPPSISTTASGSASRTSTSASSAATAPSTWRPPWFETITPSTPCSQRELRVVGGQHALHENRQRRLPAQPVEVVPGQAEVRERREHRRRRGQQILLGRLVELRQEDRVAEVLAATLAADERQVRMPQVARAPAERRACRA